MRYLLLPLFLLVCPQGSFGGGLIEGWAVLESVNISYGVVKRKEPLNGKHTANIGRSEIDYNHYFPERYKLLETPSIFHDLELERGYVSQSIMCDQYKGSHLHVSAYVKTEIFDVKRELKSFDKWVQKEAPKERTIIMGDVTRGVFPIDWKDSRPKLEKLYTKLSKQYASGIYAYTNSKGAIYRHGMTRSPVMEATDWVRMNTEIGVPDDCESLTIGFWYEGFGKSYFDHFMVVPRGEPVSDKEDILTLTNYEDSKSEKIQDFWINNEPANNRSSFINLSFEIF